MGLVLAIVLSFAPALLCAVLLYWVDQYEKEPKRLLCFVFSWGALFAAIGAIVLEVFFQAITYAVSHSQAMAKGAGAVVYAPMIEEPLKAAAVLIIFLAMRQEFDSILDGILYAATAALGFAASENVIYLYTGYLQHGAGGLFGLFVLRVVLGIWNHPLFTSFFGIGLAMARLSRSWAVRIAAPVLGLVVGVVIHSMHNALAVAYGGRLVPLAFVMDWAGWAFLAVLIFVAAWSEGRLVATELSEEVEYGILSASQLEMASSSYRRTAALARSLSQGRFLDTSRFCQACGELAHKKNQWRKVGEEPGVVTLITELRERIRDLSRVAVS